MTQKNDTEERKTHNQRAEIQRKKSRAKTSGEEVFGS